MINRKSISIIITAIVITSLILGGVGPVPVQAQGINPPDNPPAVKPTGETPPISTPDDQTTVEATPTSTPAGLPLLETPPPSASVENPEQVNSTVANSDGENTHGRVTPAERQAAAARAATARAAAARAAGLPNQAPMLAQTSPAMNFGGVPDYFGAIPNYANSPIPASIGISGDGTGAAATATLASGVVVGVTITNGGTGYSDAATSVTVVGGGGTGALLNAVIDPSTGAITDINIISGGSGYDTVPGIRKFVNSLPGLTPAGINDLNQYIPIAVADTTTYPGSDYYEIALVQYKEKLHSDLPATTLRGYVQVSTSVVPGKQIPLFYPNGNPILDKLGHQVYAVDNPHYLGPMILAGRYDPTKPAGLAGNGRPTRIKFTNYLPTGSGGNLFLPVDTTVMGAGMGPKTAAGATCDPSLSGAVCAMFTENRATLHLHGGNTPWISDGTPHQWTTPANENTPYPEGVSVYNVPDMDGGTEPVGTLTFYYTNQQSARLMFYHDHSYGITRLDVYAGEAAGYLVTDPVEQTLITGGTIPGTSVVVNPGTIPTSEIPLIIQDKTFVPSESQLAVEDPTWNSGSNPGAVNVGDLWFPHVYMPNQNPFDSMGVNAMGRWDYGPWFWPPFNTIQYGEVPNPLYPSATNPLEGPNNPGTPNPSLVPEGYMDTPLVNGTAYPFLNVLRQAYRFRILNASNDRMLNLQLYCATSNGPMWDPATGALLDANAGEVSMVPAVATAGFPSTWPTDGRAGGVPDPATAGPSMIQIGTEGGLLPAPAVISNQPVGYLYDRRNIVVLNVSTKALFLGPAERADVIIDFSQVSASCSNLILYNDAPAPVPAFDPRNDYYTGDPDNTGIGGAPTTFPGYGPNTRTIMQIQVSGTAAAPYDLAALQSALPAAFAASQPAPHVPQAAYDAAYNANYPMDAYVRIQDTTMTFTPAGSTSINAVSVTAGGTGYSFAPYVDLIGGSGSGATAIATVTGGQVTAITITNGGSGYTDAGLPQVVISGGGGTNATGLASIAVKEQLQPKAIQELFTLDYGRMNATMGVEIPSTNGLNQTTIPYGYIDPTTEIVQNTNPLTPIGTLADGTQLWKITHNGVDTHAVHFHMFNVQLINRVGWDGMIRPPDPNEIGWKETIRMNPLEDAIVALRPIIPILPFKIGNSIRPLDVTMPIGSSPAFEGQDPFGNPVTILNQMVNYGWEYVWHCHLLGHEENDMMRPMIIAVAPEAPSNLAATLVTGGSGSRLKLSWKDNSLNATSFTVERATDPAFTTNLTQFSVGKTAGISQTYSDSTIISNTLYYYRVKALVTVGGVTEAPTEPSMTAYSAPSNVVKYPTNLYSLTVISPHGTVAISPNQSSYTLNSIVRMTVTANTGWAFKNWTGGVPTPPNTSNPISVTMNADKTVTANFAPLQPTISGNAGVAGATVGYTDGTPKTATADSNGNYSFTVSVNWSGTVTPSKVGYSFSPANRPYTNISLDQTGQNYIATALTYTISGNTGVTGVTLSYTDGTLKMVNSDINGNYSLSVPFNWSGTVTPSKTGYSFSPVNATYTNVVANQIQNYIATPITFTISGNAGVGGAILSYKDGTAKTVVADGSGNYSLPVMYNWSGPVTPSLAGYTFSPALRNYTAVLANKTAQNYIATQLSITISGNAGVGGAILTYTDGITTSTAAADGNGNYSFTVLNNWSGTVTPSKVGYTFTPTNRTYSNLVVSQAAQNYTAGAIVFSISGNAGIAGATLSYTNGTPKTATADGSGNYSFTVSYNWSGTVTPSRTGYTFSPVNATYTNVLANQTQNYSATQLPNTSIITGNAGMAGVVLSYIDGTQKTTTADGSGNYSLVVSIPWSGTVTPSMAGYNFSPVNITYTNVLTNLTGQNYSATPITYTISGNGGMAGTILSYTDGTPKTATADGSGAYSFTVSYNWSGTVTPSLTGYTFTPNNATYTNVLANQTQNYIATPINLTVSGNAGVAGATLSYTDGTPKTAIADGSGNYSFTVSYNWSGAVTPSLVGFTFVPVNRTYTNVLTNQTSQNYSVYPGAFKKTGPATGATNQPTNPTLSWGTSSLATSYEYCITTTASCTTWTSAGTSTSVALSGLVLGTTYSWQVRANNATGITYADGISTALWTFTTVVPAPSAFNKISPVNGATNQPATVTLSWGASSYATSYDYCISGASGCVTWVSTGTNTSVTLNLTPGATIRWQVRANNSTGITYANGSLNALWSFTVYLPLPGAFNKSSPANGATNQSTNPTLKWGISSNAASYEYCINTTATCTTWTSAGNKTSISLTSLTRGTKYWQVRSRNATGITYANGTSAALWSFSIP